MSISVDGIISKPGGFHFMNANCVIKLACTRERKGKRSQRLGVGPRGLWGRNLGWGRGLGGLRGFGGSQGLGGASDLGWVPGIW